MPESPSLASLMESSRLPTIPAVAVEIVALVQQPDLSIDLLADSIARDPALAMRVLKTANSGLYGRPRSVTRVRDAVMVMGLRTVKTLALGFSLVGNMRTQGRTANHSIWQRSLLMAAASRTVATKAGYGFSEEAFLAGLLHGIGVIALEQALGEGYREMVAAANGDTARQRQIERAQLGFDHAEAGAALAEKWNLPEQLVTAIRSFPAPDTAPPEHRNLARCVASAEAAADLALGNDPAAALTRFRWDCQQLFGIPEAEVEQLVEHIVTGAGVLASMLDVDAAKFDAQEILEGAREALLGLSLESEREVVRLHAESERLALEASTDPLTGLSNRRHLDEFLAEQFRISTRYGNPLSVLMIDIDHFKSVNDTHGHPVGDLVLRELALSLRETQREADLCTRYGGEEFVVVLPSTPGDAAQEVAERVRSSVERRTMLATGVTLRVTVSIGVASYSAGDQPSSDWLLKEADMALYEAKRAGRNRVHRFQPAAPLSPWSIAS